MVEEVTPSKIMPYVKKSRRLQEDSPNSKVISPKAREQQFEATFDFKIEEIQDAASPDNTQKELTEDQKFELELEALKAEVTVPYLAPLPACMQNVKMYTLVLDLDETLIHFQSGEADEEGFYMIRPGCNKFLKELSQLYELVVFTAAMPDYADWILN